MRKHVISRRVGAYSSQSTVSLACSALPPPPPAIKERSLGFAIPCADRLLSQAIEMRDGVNGVGADAMGSDAIVLHEDKKCDLSL